ncbi:YhdP family phospholipid transporter [Lysobacter sp. A3-1-A15]
MPLPVSRGDVEVNLGGRTALRVRQQAGRTGVRVELGAARAPAPPPHGLVAGGRADRLDAIGWIGLARAAASGPTDAGSGGLPLRQVDVHAGRLELLGGTFPDGRVSVQPAPAGALAVRVQGPALQGSLSVPAGGATVTGRFQRVHWRTASAGTPAAKGPDGRTRTPAADVAGDPRAAPGSVAPAAGAAGAGIDPARIPPLSLDIADMRVADATLGAVTFRSRPTAAGLRVERLQARARDQAIDVTGAWTGRGTAARTHLVAGVDSDDIGALMQGLGLGGRIAGGDGNMHVDVGWAGSPGVFSLAALEGVLTLDARDGRLLEVEPGAGRVLGLLSIAELPRRLTLDFRDFFAKGFAFNRIQGSVRFADGQARSEGLRIDGPAAAIAIRGHADLLRERFDQTIEVRPKTGNLLTAVGALAGGPVGAALGAAANAVLSRPLGEIAARTYRVTGPWSDPDVQVVDERSARPVAAGKPAGG